MRLQWRFVLYFLIVSFVPMVLITMIQLEQLSRDMIITTLFLEVTLSVLIVFIAITLAKSITRPIDDLKKGADAFASGNLQYRIASQSDDEIGKVALAFDCMAEALNQEHQNLELKVQQRTEELSRSNKELDEFAYIASHDLKEPLRGIHNYAGFLMEDYADKLDNKGQEMLATVGKLTQRLEGLIDNLLHYSRLGRTNLERKDTDLNEIVHTSIETLKVFLDKNLAQVRVPEPLPVISCDPIALQEVFSNLITNAVKYNDNIGAKCVEIGTWNDASSGTHDSKMKRQTTGPVFYVKDNGIGIPEEQQNNVFTIFKRLHARNKYGGGSGAGLTIVQKIICKHGGEIWLESQVGKGTTFYFTLGG